MLCGFDGPCDVPHTATAPLLFGLRGSPILESHVRLRQPPDCSASAAARWAWATSTRRLWATGNALTTGSLVSYLARDLGAQGLALGLVLADSESGRRVAAGRAGIDLSRRNGPAGLPVRSRSASYLLIVGLPAIAVVGAVDLAHPRPCRR